MSPPKANLSRQKKSHSATDLKNLELLAQVLDTKFAIFGDRFRFGLDSFIGLIPGIGDFAGAGLSSYIIYKAYRNGVSTFVLGKMISNVMIDTVLGAVPIVGDLFDLGWHANTKNVNLLLSDLKQNQRKPRSTSRLLQAIVIIIGIALLATAGLFILLLYKLIF